MQTDNKKDNNRIVEPIVFVNNPVVSENYDVIGFNNQVETILGAIDENATMIGIIADYGTGKSSLTEMLKNKFLSKKNPSPIKINMWDSLTKTEETNSQNAVSVLTKSFLFQLANGHTRKLGSYVNKMLSKNYGSISFSSNHIIRLFIFLVLSLLFFALYKIGSVSGTGVMQYMPFGTEGVASYFKLFSPAFIVISILLAVIGLTNICVAFSHWRMPKNKDPEISDVFDLYRIIIEEIKPHKRQKQLVFIDDLDRINNKDIVIDFLKELYRFQDAIGKDKSNFVFIISVMPESRLNCNNEEIDKKIFSKIFDTTIFLKPIHYDDYDSILLKLLESNIEKKKVLEKLIGEKINDVLPVSFKWIKRGTNLTLRDIKERLNKSVSIMVSLINKSYERNSSAKFYSCAAVSYLEHRFPGEYYNLIQNEEAFAVFIKKCLPLINSVNMKRLDDFIREFDQSFRETKKDFSEDFKSELCSMIIDGIFDDDFRMYFYTYPQGSHIKTTSEREICDYLLFPNLKDNYDSISSSVDNAFKNGNNKTVDKAIRSLESYPLVLLKNDTLFVKASEISIEKLFASFRKNCIEFIDFEDNDIDIWKRVLLLKDGQRKYYIKKTTETLLDYRKVDNIILFRDKLISAVHSNISLFIELFLDDKAPIITEEEIKLIDDPYISIPLINLEKLSEDNYDYICKDITSSSLKDDPQIMGKALDILNEYNNSIGLDIEDDLLLFLKTNHLLNDEVFTSIYDVIDDEKIVDYLNCFDALELSDDYYNAINQKCIVQGLSDKLIEQLFSKDLFATGLAHYSNSNKINQFGLFGKKQDKILESCDIINQKDSSIILNIRKQAYIVLGIDEYSVLYYGSFPVITEEEYVGIEPAERAIVLLDLDRIEQNNYSIIDFVNKKEYSVNDLLILFHHLFDNENDELSYEIRTNIFEHLDFANLNAKRLSFDQRDLFYSLIDDIISMESEPKEIIDFFIRFGGFIPALEEAIYDRSEYPQLMNSFDELSNKSLEWLDDRYIPCGLSKKLCDVLYNRQDYGNYIIATALRDKKMIIEDNIPEAYYLDVYSKSFDEMFDIMANHCDFLGIFQQKATLSKYDNKHLIPAFKTIQHRRFFEYIDTLDSEIKTEYFNTFGKISSLEDSKAFRILVCKEENMELLGNEKTYYHIKEQLWDDAPQEKAQFTKAWNKRWKEELSKSSD